MDMTSESEPLLRSLPLLLLCWNCSVNATQKIKASGFTIPVNVRRVSPTCTVTSLW